MRHTVLAGGVGAARYLQGAVEAFDPADVTAVVNVADDVTLHGLRVCPDLDTCTYTLASANDPERGWGLVDESFKAMAALGRYGGLDWFSLGDRDLGTHLYRTQRLTEGATLTEVTAEISAAWGIKATLPPRQRRPDRNQSHALVRRRNRFPRVFRPSGSQRGNFVFALCRRGTGGTLS